MLVLSRRANETIRFPQLGISVSIVSVKGNRVQVGVDAPPDIQILRKELECVKEASSTTQEMPSKAFSNNQLQQSGSDKTKHDFKNRLNRATLGLHLAQKQLDAGQSQAASKTLSTALDRLKELEGEASPSTASESKTVRVVARTTVAERPDRSFMSQPDDSSPQIDVLLVEDDQNEQALMRTLLEMEGYRVHTANNGFEAMSCLVRVNPQCVLLDMMMPGCDGPELLERLRKNPSFDALPVFAVSGTSPESVGVPIGTNGVDDWFPKPLNAPRLVQHMRNRIASLCA